MLRLCSVAFFLALTTLIPFINGQYNNPVPSIIDCSWLNTEPVGYGGLANFYCKYNIAGYYRLQETLATFTNIIGAGGATPSNLDFSYVSYETTSGQCTSANSTLIIHCVKVASVDDPNTLNVTVRVEQAIRAADWQWEIVFTDSYDYQASQIVQVEILQPVLSVTFHPLAALSFTAGQLITYSANLTNTGGSFSSPLQCSFPIPAGVTASGLSSGCTNSGGSVVCRTSASTPFPASTGTYFAVNFTSASAQSGVVINASCSDVAGLFGPYYPNIASSTPSITSSASPSPLTPSIGTSPKASPSGSTSTSGTGTSTTGTSTTTTGTASESAGDGSSTTTTGNSGTGAKVMSWLESLKVLVDM